jgi:adenylate cyclase
MTAVFERLLGRAPPGLPERTRRAILQQEVEAERLIGWAQLAVLALFAALYFGGPQPFVADGGFSAAPWALAAYFVVTLARIRLCRGPRVPVWLPGASALADMALLLGLIWSFHLQYGQPPAFYLKAPTLFYAFIFIALRALRFDPLHVLLTGAAAALGWLLLVGYALWSDPAALTRDYVAYMTSSTALIGAEVDKIASIAVATLVMGLALARGRRLLFAAAAEREAAQDLSRFFAPEVARRITGAATRIAPGQGELRMAAILHCDLRGFTRLAMGMPPCALMALLAEYQARMVAAIRRHGGGVDKFLGDGIMATFGAAMATSTYAADAARAAEAMIAEGMRWNAERIAAGLPPLGFGVTLAVGPVVFGAVGDESRLEFTVIGDAVNLAAKLDKQTKIEKALILATADALALAREQGYAPRGPVEIRPMRKVEGVDAPLDLAVLAA